MTRRELDVLGQEDAGLPRLGPAGLHGQFDAVRREQMAHVVDFVVVRVGKPLFWQSTGCWWKGGKKRNAKTRNGENAKADLAFWSFRVIIETIVSVLLRVFALSRFRGLFAVLAATRPSIDATVSESG